MARRHLHYERAFERYLRAAGVPYIAVDEARRTALPRSFGPAGAGGCTPLKSFDFIVYAPGGAFLADVKGRRLAPVRSSFAAPARPGGGVQAEAGGERWATREDLDSLAAWERVFGGGYTGALVFSYWCDRQPPDGLFEDVFESEGRWYAFVLIPAASYAASARVRSPRWGTVDLDRRAFGRLSRSLLAGPDGGGARCPGPAHRAMVLS